MSFEIKKNEKILLSGPTGSGKSTLIDLILGLQKPSSGKILVDGKEVSEIGDSWINILGYVPQSIFLFDDTIKNNIKYAKENATDDEIYNVANLSFCQEFIEKLPSKYETVIGENGVRLSGGEKQRISIARAMLKKSSVILLDEATSSLDSETETKIQEALNILTRNKTTIVIAHRISTILNSNNIYLIDKGKVVENGKHEELMNKSELYRNFYEKQIQK